MSHRTRTQQARGLGGVTHLTRPMRLTLPDGSRSNSVKLTAGSGRRGQGDTCVGVARQHTFCRTRLPALVLEFKYIRRNCDPEPHLESRRHIYTSRQIWQVRSLRVVIHKEVANKGPDVQSRT